MGAGLKQGLALARKTLRIIILRHFTSTFYSALILPILAAVYLGVGVKLTNPDSKFGFGDTFAIRSLEDALNTASGGRDTVVFVNSGHAGGQIDKVIDQVAQQVSTAGFNSTRIDNEQDIGYACRSSFRATSNCFGAVVFYSSPDEGDNNYWNYTLRGDGSLGTKFKVKENKNDAQIYALPLQRAVDRAITSQTGDDGVSTVPDDTQAFAWTQKTEDEREAQLRKDYQSSFINFLAVAFLLALIGVTYHMSGFIATERELGMTQLIDAMMPARTAFKRQMVRMLSCYGSFAIVYFPGWIVASVVAGITIWNKTSFGIIIPFFVLAGLSLTSLTLLLASLWKRAQLSGSVTAVGTLIFGIIAQAIKNPNTGATTVLSLLFSPCNIVFFVKYIARYESEGDAANLVKASSKSNSSLPGIVHWIFFVVQIIGYPVVTIYLERWIHGVTTGARNDFPQGSHEAIRIEGMTKRYRPSLFRRIFSFISKPMPEVVAVDNLSLSVNKGQILALLGANGSGKSTTLDAVAGISSFDRGNLSIDTSGGLGIAPQKNVLWDDLTVKDHIKTFNRLKCPPAPDTDNQIFDLVESLGLWSKLNAPVKTLSGGQKRKLQLGLMLTGGSAICCVDEVSSGIDPLSRRKIWDILLSERGSRTIIMTTHFLDEADLLADDIAILSKGTLRAEGSSVELKNTLGAGYRIHLLDARQVANAPEVPGAEKNIASNTITYVAPSSRVAADVTRALEGANIKYQFSGPTIEDVFLQVAEEVKGEEYIALDQDRQPGSARPPMNRNGSSHDTEKTRVAQSDKFGGLGHLQSGKPTGPVKQVMVLFRKRLTIFKKEWLPYVVALLIPIIAAGITQLLIRNKEAAGCTPGEQSTTNDNDDFYDLLNSVYVVGGPSKQFGDSTLSDLFKSILPDGSALTGSDASNLTKIDSFSSFTDTVKDKRDDISPAAWWLSGDGKPATLAYKVDEYSMYTAVLGQNFMNVMLSKQTIAAAYKPFDSPVAKSTGDALQLVVYLGVALNVVPGLFGLYVNRERRNNIRGLQYSSGARSVPLWLSHLLFDFSIVLVSMIVVAAVFISTSDIWFYGGYLFPIFILYGLASLLLSYRFSLIFGSALSTYAGVTAFQAVGFAIYMIAYLFILTYSSATSVDKNVEIGNWVISLIFPIGSLLRTLIVSLNSFGAACDGTQLKSNPASMTAYGGPILYLCLQTVILFAMLIFFDSGVSKFSRGKAVKSPDSEDPELADELVRVTGPEGQKTDGLRTVHLTKAFKKQTAVDNVSFGVEHGEVFALLGPNGAGKSTTISLIRGDLAPSQNGGDVFVENHSVNKKRAAARANLGVCPQYDAIDSMSVREHLEFYARLRGIDNVKLQVASVIEAVGLGAYTEVMANTLSGGNKRKLSLAIALTGNPSVILLDEPSSGLDAAAKRIMWKTLETIVPGRSILLTTHSMEEADALAHRAGILATRMLALGTTDNLRHRFGDTLHVHMVSKTAPHSSQQEMDAVRSWVLETFPSAQVEQATYHGQMRFSVPASAVLDRTAQNNRAHGDNSTSSSGSAIGQLLIILEEHKDALGIAHHSVSPTTLNQVFLSIVGQHNVQEEGYSELDNLQQQQQQNAGGIEPGSAGVQGDVEQGGGVAGADAPVPVQQLQLTAKQRARQQKLMARRQKPWYKKQIWEFF